MVLFTYLVIIACLIAGIVSLGSWVFGISQRKEKPQLITKPELTALRERARLGEKLARTILNGAGNPVLEAQDTVEQIEKTYETKELY